jgi:CheY-like chemotaxis protein
LQLAVDGKNFNPSRRNQMVQQCFSRDGSDPPVCAVHKVRVVQKQIPIDPNAPALGRVTCNLCPVSQMVIQKAGRLNARPSDNPLSESPARRATNFPVVPMNEVPMEGTAPDPAPHRPIVLVVDDEPSFVDAVVEILNRNGYTAIPAYDVEDAMEAAALVPPELVISAVRLPGKSGQKVAAMIKTKLPGCKVLLLTEPESAVYQSARQSTVSSTHA